MKNFLEILDTRFFGNTLMQYLILVFIILLGLICKRLFSRVSSRLLYKLFNRYSTDISVEKFVDYMRKPTALLILLAFVYGGFAQLNYPDTWNLVPHNEFGLKMVVERAFLIVVISAIIWAFMHIIDVFSFIMISRANKTETKLDNQIIPFMFDIIKLIVVIIGVFVILGTVFELNVGSLIAGLGIGGLAVALAAKETLENLLGSFTIFLDKPFVIGDLVKVGDVTGVVEKVGFRSTRLRTLEQTFVTVPNKKMVDAELDNISQRSQQRVKFVIKLKIDTTESQLKNICHEIKDVLQMNRIITGDQTVSLYQITDIAIEILVIYFVDSPDYNKMLIAREEINFNILSIINNNGAQIASPAFFSEK